MITSNISHQYCSELKELMFSQQRIMKYLYVNKKHQWGDWILSGLIPTFLNPQQNFLVFCSICYACLH